jgi:hypothetical protein
VSTVIAPRIRSRLLSLADREFQSLIDSPARTPTPRRFRALKINLARFDRGWDRKRGAAVRLMGILLRQDAAELRNRVCTDAQTAKTYAGAVIWLQQEARYLRKMANMLDTAVGRLTVVLAQCEDGDGVPPSN